MREIDICIKCQHFIRLSPLMPNACKFDIEPATYPNYCDYTDAIVSRAFSKLPIPKECPFTTEQIVAELNTEKSTSDIKHCEYCGHRMPFYRLKCKHCKQWQPRRFMALQVIMFIILCISVAYDITYSIFK